MDYEAFTTTLDDFFVAVIETYQAETDCHVNSDLLKTILKSMFWDPVTLDKPSETVSIYERVNEALKLVFWHNSREAGLDSAAVQKVLPEWSAIFSEIFNQEIRYLLPIYAPHFDIWEFTGPTMTVDLFLELLNKHITAYEHIHDIENADLVPRQHKIIPKAGGDTNARPTRGTTHDPNFYHRCMFCTRQDQNDRDDASVDHMQSFHNYYATPEYRDKRAREVVHQKRKHAPLLKILVTKERAVYNCLATRLHEAKRAVAALEGTRYLAIPRLRDVQGGDLDGLDRLQLAEKLCAERAQLLDCDLDGRIRQVNGYAWEVAHLQIQEFDWTGTPDV